MKALKRTLIILIIILLTLISFGGIFIQKTKFVENILPEFKLGATLSGLRNTELDVSKETNTVIYDKDGKVVEEEGEGTTKQEIPVNKDEVLTSENYEISKKIIEKRLNSLKQIQYTSSGIEEKKAVEYYIIKQDKDNGNIFIQIPENDNTNMVLQYMAIKGTFNIVDESNNILMDNSHIEKANVGYNSTDSGVTVYLNIQFNKEGTEKLKEISNTFIKTTDEEGNDTTKKITIKIDDTEMLSTYFAQEISNGTIQLSFGTANNSTESLASYVQEASNLATLLNTGNLPVAYSIEENRYVLSDIDMNTFKVPLIFIASLLLVSMLVLIFKYKLNGLLGALSIIGYIATLLVIIRLTNVIITFEGIAGILTSIILDYIFIIYLLNRNEQLTYNQIFVKHLFILIPITITTIILCFTKWLPIYSFGMTMFWGITFIVLYNFAITKTLISKK